MKPLRVQFEGLVRSPVSWARVLRETVVALWNRPGLKVGFQPRRGFKWSRRFELPSAFQQCPRELEDPDLLLTFGFPPQLERYEKRGRPVWHFSVYEASRLPPDWVAPLRDFGDRILVPSRHVRRTYRRSGVPPNKISLVPYGYNRSRFPPPERKPERSIKPPLRVLTLATPHYRKGLDLLLEVSDLVERGRVRWRIHSPYDPAAKNTRFWEDPEVLRRLSRAGFEVSCEPMADGEVAELLKQADLSVQPSRSEGFGLAILEAMAAGTAVVTSNWGGHLDFSGEGMIRLRGRMRPARNCQYHQRNPRARVFEPDTAHLRSTIKTLIGCPDSLPVLGSAARRSADAWSWKRSGRILEKTIRRHLGS